MIDPFSAIIGTAQIAGQCAIAISALVKYIGQVATVDDRIRGFHDDITRLQATYDSLQKCRNAPPMMAAARNADTPAQDLWSDIATTLNDCENTLAAINVILSRINKPLGLGSSLRRLVDGPVKQLREQLNGGELERHHDKIRMFNNRLMLSLQVIEITLQLNQSELSENNHQKLMAYLTEMQATLNSLNSNIADLRRPRTVRRSSTVSSATLIIEQTTEEAVCNHMEDFAQRATKFLTTASSAATTRSSASTIYLNSASTFRGTSEVGTPLTRGRRDQIENWMPPLDESPNSSPTLSESIPSPFVDHTIGNIDEEDFELDLVRKFFKNGQVNLEQDKLTSAEENFKEAHNVLQKKNFGQRLAFQSADVVLMLSHCYVEQNKLDEAIKLLLPLIGEPGGSDSARSSTPDGRSLTNNAQTPDHGRILAVHHTLGNAYLKKKDYDNAVTHSVYACNGRKRLFGPTHDRYKESVKLVVDVYTAMERLAVATAYSEYLTSDTNQDRRIQDPPRRFSTTVVAGPASRPSARPAHAEQPQPPPALPAAPSPPPNTIVSDQLTNEPSCIDGTSTITTRSTGPSSGLDDVSTVSSVSRSLVTVSSSIALRNYIKPRFDEVKKTAARSKGKACDATRHLLESYHPHPRILQTRWDEIKQNIKEGGANKGLAATGYGYAPIHFFCELTGRDEAITEVALLIDEGVDVMAVCHKAGYRKDEPTTPLQMAIAKGHQALATILIDALYKADLLASKAMRLKDQQELSPLLAACRQGQIATVTRFLEYDARVVSGFPRSWCGNSLLHDAASRCHIDMVALLLKFQTEAIFERHDVGTLNQPDEFGRTPLMYAVMSTNIGDPTQRALKVRSRLGCVRTLITLAGPELETAFRVRDAKGETVLGYAKDEGDAELTQLLEQYCAATNGRGSISPAWNNMGAVELLA